MKELIAELKQHQVDIEVIDDQLKLTMKGDDPIHGLIKKVKENKERLISYIKTHQSTRQTACDSEELYEASISQQASLLATVYRNKKLKHDYSFNISKSFILEGLDVSALVSAFELLIERHEILRTVLMMHNGTVKQRILPAHLLPWSLVYIDIRVEVDKKKKLTELTNEQVIFDFEKGPLFDPKLIQIEDDKHNMLFTIHHGISDRWSLGIIERELEAAYIAFCQGKQPILPAVGMQFKDYIKIQSTENSIKNKRYWTEKLQQLPSVNLATSRAKNWKGETEETYKEKLRRELREGDGYQAMTPEEEERFFGVLALINFRKGRKYDYSMNTQRFEVLEKLAVDANTSISIVVTALFYMLLTKVTKGVDHIVALNIMLREKENVKNLIGLLTNTVFLRNELDENETAKDFVKKVSSNLFEAYEYGTYPVEKLINELDVPLHAISKTFLNVMVVEGEELTSSAFTEGHDDSDAHPYFDMDFGVNVFNNGLKIQCSYVSDLYSKDTMEDIFLQLGKIVDDLKDNYSVPLQNILL